MKLFKFLSLLNLIVLSFSPLISGDYNYELKLSEDNITGDTHFGRSVSNAGDVNGDGFDDTIVGTNLTWPRDDYVYIFLGGTDPDTIPDIILKSKSGYFGYSVSYAGDLNKDGFSDVIVGAYGFNHNHGRAYIYFGGADMDSVPDLIINNNQDDYQGYFGKIVSAAGDLNKDGFDDILISAPYEAYRGSVSILFGGASMDNEIDLKIIGNKLYSRFGSSVKGCGDLNNDGFADFAVGDNKYESYTGRTFIYFGAAQMDTIADLILTGEKDYDNFGYSVSSAGDFNNDGFDDLLIGAKGDINGYGNDTGRVYIYYGATIMDTIFDIKINGKEPDTYFGSSVSEAGDLNSDGFGDIVVGAPGMGTGFNIGKGYIFFGSSDSLNTDKTITIHGLDKNYRLGGSVSKAGDINNDSFPDIIIGDSGYDVERGCAYILYGGTDMDSTPDKIYLGEGTLNNYGGVYSAGDVNNDGYDDFLVSAIGYGSISFNDSGRVYLYYGSETINDKCDVTFTGEDVKIGFGSSLSASTDINSDGYSDFLIGAAGYNNSHGRVYIYYGGDIIDYSSDIILTGKEEGERFGSDLSSGGDINKDGYDDFLVSAESYDNYRGRVFVYFGGQEQDTIPGLILVGANEGDMFGRSISSNGDINGDGYCDIIIGASGAKENAGEVYLFFGNETISSTPDVTFSGTVSSTYFGGTVLCPGDISGDGYDDLMIQSNYEVFLFQGGTNPDNVYEYLFSDLGWEITGGKDINNDNIMDFCIGDPSYQENRGKVSIFFGSETISENADIILEGEVEHDYYGSAISFPGDINKDGYEDVLVGAPYNGLNGSAYLYLGNELQTIDENSIFTSLKSFHLCQNFPNPFNSATQIKFSLKSASNIELKIYDSLGRVIKTLLNEKINQGSYDIIWNGKNNKGNIVNSGIYFYQLKIGSNDVLVKKMLYIK
jgi:hypothetical protein